MIRVEGLSLEKFLNVASREGIRVFDVSRYSYTVLQARVSSGGFKKLNRLALDRYKITVLKRAGVPFGLKWIAHRKVLLFGLIIVAFAGITASLFVWDVRVSGLEDKEAAAIIVELEELGIEAGAYKGSLDLDKAELSIIVEHEEIAWININIKGVVAFVEIVLAEPIPKIIDEDTPCNIVAVKDGYIESITALCGRAAVQPGDTVRKGDVLISGLIWNAGMPRMLFAARGEVVANVWYTAALSKPLYIETRKQTGRTQTQRIIYIGKDSAAIDGQCSFDEYDTSVENEYYIGGRLFLPVKVAVLQHSEISVTKTPAPLQTLKTYLEERAYYEAKAKVGQGVKIVGHQAFFEVEEDILTVTVYLQTQEDIGKTVYLEE